MKQIRQHVGRAAQLWPRCRTFGRLAGDMRAWPSEHLHMSAAYLGWHRSQGLPLLHEHHGPFGNGSLFELNLLQAKPS